MKGLNKQDKFPNRVSVAIIWTFAFEVMAENNDQPQFLTTQLKAGAEHLRDLGFLI